MRETSELRSSATEEPREVYPTHSHLDYVAGDLLLPLQVGFNVCLFSLDHAGVDNASWGVVNCFHLDYAASPGEVVPVGKHISRAAALAQATHSGSTVGIHPEGQDIRGVWMGTAEEPRLAQLGNVRAALGASR